MVSGGVRAAAPAYIDGGNVEVDAGSGAVDTATLPWVNGPQQTLQTYPGEPASPWAGRTAFAGDSFGWTASQLDLSSFAGQTVRPKFTLRGDQSVGFIGWWLDDIVVYTCDIPAPPTTTAAGADGSADPDPDPDTARGGSSSSTTKLKVKIGRSVKIVATVKTSTGAAATGKVNVQGGSQEGREDDHRSRRARPCSR